MTDTPDSKPEPVAASDLPKDQATPPQSPQQGDEAEAMEEAQKEGAEQRKEGGYQ